MATGFKHARPRIKELRDWAVLIFGAASLAFAVVASSTGLVSAESGEPAATGQVAQG